MKKNFLADFSLLSVVIVWGYTFVAIKNALLEITPFNFIAIRFVLSLLILVIIFRKRLTGLNRFLFLKGGIIGIFLFLAYAFQTMGILYTSASNAGFITGFSVVLVPVFSALILKSRPPVEGIIGTAMAFIGVVLLFYNDSYVMNKGDVLIFLCAIAITFHILSVGYYTGKTDSVLLTIVQIAVVTILSVICALLFEEPAIPRETVVWQAIFITSVFATVGAYLIQNIAQRTTSTTHTAIIFSAEPVFAGIFGYFLLGERPGNLTIIGFILILAGMIISELKFQVRRGKS